MGPGAIPALFSMGYKIRISREWSCSHRGAQAVAFAPGEYHIPDEMSDFLAQRCLREGRGIVIDNDEGADPLAKKRSPSNKMRGRMPENKAAP